MTVPTPLLPERGRGEVYGGGACSAGALPFAPGGTTVSGWPLTWNLASVKVKTPGKLARNDAVASGCSDVEVSSPCALPTRSPDSLKSCTSTEALIISSRPVLWIWPSIVMPSPAGLSIFFQLLTASGPLLAGAPLSGESPSAGGAGLRKSLSVSTAIFFCGTSTGVGASALTLASAVALALASRSTSEARSEASALSAARVKTTSFPLICQVPFVSTRPPSRVTSQSARAGRAAVPRIRRPRRAAPWTIPLRWLIGSILLPVGLHYTQGNRRIAYLPRVLVKAVHPHRVVGELAALGEHLLGRRHDLLLVRVIAPRPGRLVVVIVTAATASASLAWRVLRDARLGIRIGHEIGDDPEARGRAADRRDRVAVAGEDHEEMAGASQGADAVHRRVLRLIAGEDDDAGEAEGLRDHPFVRGQRDEPPLALAARRAGHEVGRGADVSRIHVQRLIVELRLRQPGAAGGEIVVDDQIETADLVVEVPQVLAVAGAEGEGVTAQFDDVEGGGREVDRPASSVEDRERIPRGVGDPLHRRRRGQGRHRLVGGEGDVLEGRRRADVHLVHEAGDGADVDGVQITVLVLVEHRGVGRRGAHQRALVDRLAGLDVHHVEPVAPLRARLVVDVHAAGEDGDELVHLLAALDHLDAADGRHRPGLPEVHIAVLVLVELRGADRIGELPEDGREGQRAAAGDGAVRGAEAARDDRLGRRLVVRVEPVGMRHVQCVVTADEIRHPAAAVDAAPLAEAADDDRAPFAVGGGGSAVVVGVDEHVGELRRAVDAEDLMAVLGLVAHDRQRQPGDEGEDLLAGAVGEGLRIGVPDAGVDHVQLAVVGSREQHLPAVLLLLEEALVTGVVGAVRDPRGAIEVQGEIIEVV